MGRKIFALLLWAWAANACNVANAAAPSWLVLEGEPHLSLEGWQVLTGFKPLADPKSGRILLERRNSPPLILLLDSPYALQSARFLALPTAPFRKDGKIWLSRAAAERLFPPLLTATERKEFTHALGETPTPSEPVPPAPKAAKLAVSPAPPPPAPLPALGLTSCRLGRPVKRIFLDPGHGGDDAGTTHDHVAEKTVVLQFAQLAADELRRHGFEVSFSRTRDVFLPLDVRTKLAERWKADLFISLHVNSSPLKEAHGTETYILSQDATDAEARKLALLENSIASSARASESAVQDILWDMEQTSYLQDSAYLASYLQGAIVAHAHELLEQKKVAGDWKNRGVRQAPFYVLSRAAMPAVLVELGYLSNARDRRLLGEKFFQESLAKALAEGVKKYKDACHRSS